MTEEQIESVLLLLAPRLPEVDIEVELRDPEDAPVVAAALAGGAEIIVTGDRHLLDDKELRDWLAARGVEVLRPLELVERLNLP